MSLNVGQNYIGFIIGTRANGKLVVAHLAPNCLIPSIGISGNQMGFIIGSKDEPGVGGSFEPIAFDGSSFDITSNSDTTEKVLVYRGRCTNGKLNKSENYIAWIAGTKSNGNTLAITECGDCSSDPYGSASSAPYTPTLFVNPCCNDGSGIPYSLSGNVKNTIQHDTGLTLTYFPHTVRIYNHHNLSYAGQADILPPGIPREAFPNVPAGSSFGVGVTSLYVQYPPAWYSSLIHDYDGGVNLSGNVSAANLGGFPAQSQDYTIAYTYSVYYYVVYGWDMNNSVVGTIADQTTSCTQAIIQVCYPVGAITYAEPAFTTNRTNGVFSFGAVNPEPISYPNNTPPAGSVWSLESGIHSSGLLETAVTGNGWGDGSEYNSLICNPFHYKECLVTINTISLNNDSKIVLGATSPFLGTKFYTTIPGASYEPGGDCTLTLPTTQALLEVFT